MKKIHRLLRYDLPLHFVLLLTNWMPDNVLFLRLRGALSKPFLGECGNNLRLGRNVTFYNPSNIHLGSDVYIAYGGWFMAGEKITIGNEVLFGPYCVVVSSNHRRTNRSFRYGEPNQKPIVVEDGVWVGTHVSLLAGCLIGQGSLVAAGAVVSGVFDADNLIGGVPAKIIKKIEDDADAI